MTLKSRAASTAASKGCRADPYIFYIEYMALFQKAWKSKLAPETKFPLQYTLQQYEHYECVHLRE